MHINRGFEVWKLIGLLCGFFFGLGAISEDGLDLGCDVGECFEVGWEFWNIIILQKCQFLLG